MNRRRPIRWNSLPLLGVISACATSFAADDDIVVDGITVETNAAAIVLNGALNQQQQLQLIQKQQLQLRAVQIREDWVKRESDAQLEQFIFAKDMSAQRGRWKMNGELVAAINTIERVCQITAAQKQKLMLAGRADRKHFFDRLDAIQKQRRSANGLTQEMREEAIALRKTADAGLLGSNSFFAKAIPTTLTGEQLEECQRVHRLVLVESTVAAIENEVRLQPWQRQALVKLMCNEIAMESVFWDSDWSYRSFQMKTMLHQVALVADEKVKPLLNDIQWKNLVAMIAVHRGLDEEEGDGQVMKAMTRLK